MEMFLSVINMIICCVEVAKIDVNFDYFHFSDGGIICLQLAGAVELANTSLRRVSSCFVQKLGTKHTLY